MLVILAVLNAYSLLEESISPRRLVEDCVIRPDKSKCLIAEKITIDLSLSLKYYELLHRAVDFEIRCIRCIYSKLCTNTYLPRL